MWLSDRSRVMAVWAALATASLAAAAWLALQPGRSGDLGIVLGWLQYLKTTGASVYPVESLRVDYPPHALLLLWPLGWLPEGREALVYLPLNLVATLGMACLVPWWMAREARVVMSIRTHVVFALMVLTWGAVRVAIWNGQTVALALSAGILAVSLSATWPRLGSMALVVAATKPSLGVGVGLLLLFRAQYRVLATAGAGVLGLTLAYDVLTGMPLLSSMTAYTASLLRMYAVHDWVRGVTTIRAAIHDGLGGHWVALPLFVAFGVAMLMVLIRVALPVRRLPEAQALLAAACLVWTLVALPNQRYYLVLFAPVVWLLIHRPTAWRMGPRWPLPIAAGLIVFNVIDGPIALRYFAERFGERWPDLMAWLWWATYVAAAPLAIGVYLLLLRAIRASGASVRRGTIGS